MPSERIPFGALGGLSPRAGASSFKLQRTENLLSPFPRTVVKTSPSRATSLERPSSLWSSSWFSEIRAQETSSNYLLSFRRRLVRPPRPPPFQHYKNEKFALFEFFLLSPFLFLFFLYQLDARVKYKKRGKVRPLCAEETSPCVLHLSFRRSIILSRFSNCTEQHDPQVLWSLKEK